MRTLSHEIPRFPELDGLVICLVQARLSLLKGFWLVQVRDSQFSRMAYSNGTTLQACLDLYVLVLVFLNSMDRPRLSSQQIYSVVLDDGMHYILVSRLPYTSL